MPEALETSQQHRRLVLKALLWLTVGGGLVFGAVNVGREMWLLAGLEIIYALFALSLLRIVDTTPHLRMWTLIYLFPFFALMTFALVLPRTSFTVFAWIQTVPIICYLLLGLRGGLWMSLGFLSLGVVAFNYRYMTDDSWLNIMVAANVGLSSAAILLFSHIYERSRVANEARLLELASTDTLTGLANRMKLAEVFQRERSHALRDNNPLSLIILDLDHFKHVNDQFGHEGGDRALRHIAQLLPQRLRDTDLFCRLGGEEFAVLLPGADLAQAAERANKLRELLAEHPPQIAEASQVMTFSAGVATLGEDGQSLDSLMVIADRRMYEAKGGGRNQVVAAGQQYHLAPMSSGR
ncbi:GGDEF domain-containing protein [Halopseudomonas pelagia]|uniref:diguanylate cyclase n=1 Tax=Halopseudomonas pelagia TaxID=553151 RepID=A0AA91U1N4_9GAMM|nr:GGDEF domain-containing protein [Halopseudomonas pelagia]PCC98849.1 GGDEF domain-containing protein [Halopseudomonas pelagia]QFY58321.1 GGDEF domain-containing protein [Halopseudomonas pelagia]